MNFGLHEEEEEKQQQEQEKKRRRQILRGIAGEGVEEPTDTRKR